MEALKVLGQWSSTFMGDDVCRECFTASGREREKYKKRENGKSLEKASNFTGV